MPFRPLLASLALLISLLAASCVATPKNSTQDALPARTALDDYVEKPDPSYRWELARTLPLDGADAHVLKMVSQTWRKPDEVDRTVWEHWVTIVSPHETTSDVALLFISGGSNGGEAPSKVDPKILGIAALAGVPVVELRMIPNQPLIFHGDGKPRGEDDLIVYTWNQYLKTGDPTWLARMPMVKSAVRAMDTVQAFLASPEGGKLAIRRFIVAGGSKRGWTTWLTGAVDKRVAGIIPIVIDVLNMMPSMEHHFAAYGFWAPAVGDYEHGGIMDRKFDPKYEALRKLVDPYYYRHRLTMPKLVLNSAGDQFFLPDSSQFYFGDLAGEKHLRYVPNSNHSLSGTDAVESIATFTRMVAKGETRPDLSWTFEGEGGIEVQATQRPREVLLWQANNPKARDFRQEAIGNVYTSSPAEALPDGGYRGRVTPPAEGWSAYFVEATFDTGGPAPLKLTTPVRVIPDTLPHQAELDAINERLHAAQSP